MAVTSSSSPIFSYRNGDTFMHKMPPLIKLIFLFGLCIFTFSGKNCNNLSDVLSLYIIITTSVCFFITILAFFLSGAHFASLKKLKFILVLGAIVTLFRTIVIPKNENASLLCFSFPLSLMRYISFDGFACGILYTIRFFITTFAAIIVFETTSPMQIKESLDIIQNSLAKIFPKIKKANPALVISLAINFIPEIFQTWKKIKLASRSRSNKKPSFKQSVNCAYQELTSLLLSLLHQADLKRKAIINRS